jgi:O-acetyl-ADP-ribose deacetylase (regulator of RNase III)
MMTRQTPYWPEAMATMDVFDVDFAKLATISPFLDGLSATVTEKARPTAQQANRAAHPQADGVECALGSVLITEAGELSRALNGTFEAVDNNLRAVAESLAETAKAVVRIGERYRTAEARNLANAADIASMLPR